MGTDFSFQVQNMSVDNNLMCCSYDQPHLCGKWLMILVNVRVNRFEHLTCQMKNHWAVINLLLKNFSLISKKLGTRIPYWASSGIFENRQRGGEWKRDETYLRIQNKANIRGEKVIFGIRREWESWKNAKRIHKNPRGIPENLRKKFMREF